MAKTGKPRSHNEWFRPVSLGGRKSCPSCGERLGPGESFWSWGEYLYGKWRTVRHFCPACWSEVAARLRGHTAGCGCSVALVVRGGPRPPWLTLEEGGDDGQ